MATRFRVRELIDEINQSRQELGAAPVSDAEIARAASIDRATLYRITSNGPIGKHLMAILDRLMHELSTLAARPIDPGDIFVRVPDTPAAPGEDRRRRARGKTTRPRPKR